MTDNAELQRWNSRFAADEYVFGTAPNAFLASQKALLKSGQRALAVADGEGRNGVWLAQQGLDVLSVDFSPVGLAKAKALADQAGVALRTQCVDLATWSWDGGPFDVVVGIFIQFADPALRAVIFQRMKDVLKPGGLILLTGYGPKQLDYKTGGPSKLEHLYTAAMLRAEFSDMTILHLAEHDDVVDEGVGHSGMSALVDLVARKTA